MRNAILVLILVLFCGTARANEDMFNFGTVPEFASVSAESPAILELSDIAIPLAEESPPVPRPHLFGFFQRFRERRLQGFLLLSQDSSAEGISVQSFRQRLLSLQFLRRQGRIQAVKNFAATGVNTRLRGLANFFPRSLFSF